MLRRHRLVLSARRASHVYYRLADPRAAELLAVARALLLRRLDGDSQRLASAQDLPALPGGAA